MNRSGATPGATDAHGWTQFGDYVRQGRERAGLDVGQAAERAGLGESDWRAFEAGYREEFGGVRVLPNPTPDVLDRIATTLGVPVEELGARLGPVARNRPVDAHREPPVSELARRVDQLPPADRHLVEALVDRLLGQPGP
ncbi:MAG: helix-turn-helix transcriptional regulator [Acidimicrobiia bacterium]|nr:helix-turn-helix transcriptional regulator [Acidimicrobiia bacterium]